MLLDKILKNKERDEVVWIALENKKKKDAYTQSSQNTTVKKSDATLFSLEKQDISMHCAPLLVGEFAQEYIFSQLNSVVLSSATLTSVSHDLREAFAYYANELGFSAESEQLLYSKLASPFDYSKRALLYTPQNIADPVRAERQYYIDTAREIHQLLQLSQGGAFVLFTSIKALQSTKAILEEQPQFYQTAKYSLISQKDPKLSPQAALALFKSQKNAALLGLATFWQGIDIQGEQLRLVILCKIPFKVPTEPILSARMELEEEQQRNPFLTLQIPQATIHLKQGFGRLIRSASDRGVIAILDPRLYTKRYGEAILASLPPAKRVSEFEHLKANYQALTDDLD